MLPTRKSVSTVVLLLFSILFSDHSRSVPRRYLIIQADNDTKEQHSIGSFVVDYERMHSVVSLIVPEGDIKFIIKYDRERIIHYHAIFPHYIRRNIYSDDKEVPASLLVNELLKAFNSFQLLLSPPSVITSGYQVNPPNIEALRETIFFDAHWQLQQIDGARLFFRADLPEQDRPLNYDLCNRGFYFTLEPPVHSPEPAHFYLTMSYLAKVLQLGLIALLLPDLINPTLTEFVPFRGATGMTLEPIKLPRPAAGWPFFPLPDNDEPTEEPDPSWMDHDVERDAENWGVLDLARRLQAIDL